MGATTNRDRITAPGGEYRISKDLILYNENCITGATRRIASDYVDLIIADPPFGIKETKIGSYNHDKSFIIPGYVEAPDDYEEFTLDWMTQAKRVLKPNGSMYIIIGHSRLREVLNAGHELNLSLVNHIIWKYDFGVFTKRRYVTSHYNIVFYAKPGAHRTFNTDCRYSADDRHFETGNSLRYADLEDVFYIKRDRRRQTFKNGNKLPQPLIEKLIQYSSNPGDLVCDFFMGNFTTAYAARSLNRRVRGFELNPNVFEYHLPELKRLEDDRHSNKYQHKPALKKQKDYDNF